MPRRRRRRAQRRTIWQRSLTERLYEAQAGSCFFCRETMAPGPWSVRRRGGFTKDHVVPKSRGGSAERNVVLACKPCNGEKSDRLPTPEELARLDMIYRLLDETGRIRLTPIPFFFSGC